MGYFGQLSLVEKPHKTDALRLAQIGRHYRDWPIAEPSHSSNIRAARNIESASNSESSSTKHSKTKHSQIQDISSVQNTELNASISGSSWLHDLEDNWDGEGSLAPTKFALAHSRRFLLENSALFSITNGHPVPPPDISIGPLGTVDILWRTEARELLVNYPSSPDDTIKYYGDNGDGEEPFKGEFNVTSPSQFLFVWLARK